MTIHHQIHTIFAFAALFIGSPSSFTEALSFYKGGSAVLSARVHAPPAVSTSQSQSLDDIKEKEGLKLCLVTFYHFTPIDDVISTRNQLWKVLVSLGREEEEKMDWITPFSSTTNDIIGGHNRPFLEYVSPRGTIYVAPEGINGQLALTPELASHLEDALKSVEPFYSISDRGEEEFELNWGETIYIKPSSEDDESESSKQTQPFRRLVVRARKQILTDNLPSDVKLDLHDRGVELSAEEWHQQLQQTKEAETTSPPLILDCRNTYESDEGIFQNAIPLETQTFGDTWDALKEKLSSSNDDLQEQQQKEQQPVYIYCTGGIRCVKVGAYLKQHLGVKDVRSLRHGIVGYERWVNDQEEGQEHIGNTDEQQEETKVESLWSGKNFHFDQRDGSRKEMMDQKENAL